MHIYRARGAVIDWELANPVAGPPPSPLPAQWEASNRSAARVRHSWAAPAGAGPSPSPAPGHWDVLGRDSARVLQWWARAEGAGPVPSPAPAPAGGWPTSRKPRRYDFLAGPTRERLTELAREQREAMGILPRGAQRRIEAAVKKEVRRTEPGLAPLAPVAAEVAQDTGTPLKAVIEAIQRVFAHQQALTAARIEADTARRREAEQAAAEEARAQAEAIEQARQQHLARLHAEDDELLRQAEAERAQAIETIRQVQKALLALIGN